jgi:hypothetical protein
MKNLPDDFNLIQNKAKKVLRDIKRRAGNMDKKHPTYKNIHCKIEDEDEFIFWYYMEYRRQSINHPNEVLMLDRINNLGHYEMKNIQLVPQLYNEVKKALDHAIQYCGREPKEYEKYCHSCKSIKTRATDFHTDSHELDNLRAICKECTNTSARQKRKEKKNERS